MQNENLDFLKNNLKYLGFGDQANERLQKEIGSGKESFNIELVVKPKSPELKDDQSVKYNLAFAKSKTSDNYYLNSYTAKLQGTDIKEAKEQNFTVHNGNGVTAKEAFNLISGRAINKDITNTSNEKFNAWIKLNNVEDGGPDKKYYNKNYGFDLEKVVDALGVKFNENFTRDSVLKSLEKGNLQAVIVEKNNTAEQIFIAANPQFKKLDIYDKDLKLVYVKGENIKPSLNPWEGGQPKEHKPGLSR